MIYDGAFGLGEVVKGEVMLGEREVHVADVDDNRVPMPMKDIWDAIVSFGYDGAHDDDKEGLVVNGQIKVFQSEEDMHRTRRLPTD